MLSTISRRPTRRESPLVLAVLVALLCAYASPLYAGAPSVDASSPSQLDGAGVLLAQADEEPAEGKLEPRYKPREPEEKSSYNGSYVFGMTRGVADSTIHPAVKAPLFLFTIPLDIVLLPFAAIGGAFG
jgi:hypothetical protein